MSNFFYLITENLIDECLHPWKFKMERYYIKEKIYNYIDGLAEWLKQWNPPGL